MSIPVVEKEHIEGCCAKAYVICQGEKLFYNGHPGCPACAVEANNKAWAKWLMAGNDQWVAGNPAHWEYAFIAIPASDWEQIKKLAENKED